MDAEKLITASLERIRKMACRYSRDTAAADDLAGETVYRMLRAKDRFDTGRPLLPWAARIMHNLAVNGYLRDSCVGMLPLDEDAVDSVASIPGEIYPYRELIDIIENLAARHPKVKAVLDYAKGYSYEEIAQESGVPVSTARTRVFYGRRMLAAMLGA